jgi:hypothetical protein
MENLVFIIWILFFPISVDISEWLSDLKEKYLYGKKLKEGEDNLYTIFLICIWFGIGFLLYKPTPFITALFS